MTGSPAQPGASKRRKLVVIDGANTIYRAFFAIPNLRAPDGRPTGAAYGFVTMLSKVLREEAPDYVAVAFDPRGGSFRNEIFDAYKAGRDKQPEDLSAQIPLVRKLAESFRVPIVEVPSFEADDVIATLVETVPDDVDVAIVSTDKDLMQLVGEHVVLLDTMKDRRIGPDEVEERFGVPPDKLLDLRALVGDSSDNIPGVKGIGEKGAAKLIAEFGSLEALLENAEGVSAKRAREALQNHADDARLSKELSTLRTDVPLEGGLDALKRAEPDVEALRTLYTELGFNRLIAQLDEAGAGASAPAASAEASEIRVRVIEDAKGLSALVAALAALDCIVIEVVATAGSAVETWPVGVAFALGEGEAAYVRVDLPDQLPEALSPEALGEALRRLWPDAPGEGGPRPWSAARGKATIAALAQCGVRLPAPVFDAEIAAGLLEPGAANQITAVAQQRLGVTLEPWEKLAGRGAKEKAPETLEVKAVADWAGVRACTVARLASPLREALGSQALVPLFDEIECPLVRVLATVERSGVRIDEKKLADLSIEYDKELTRIEAEIHRLAGEPFLVSSPKQLQTILFDKLKLPIIKKTKTGYSTDEGVLEQLAVHHELPGQVLAWRKLSKLKSTYIDALPPLVSERTGRIHPHFNQLGAATGRLSAQHPNVQNIPIRGEEGARIREAFIPAEGRVLVSADYSQVELRILAHYARDESLIEAFKNGEDIHRRTAAEVAGIAIEDVDAERRARAKAVNFGIIYGSSAFGLAQQLGIAAGEAQETIDAYFARYEGVRRFLDQTIATAKKQGYVVTHFGRRRPLPDLSSRNRVLRQAAERMAVNTVIQGTAADVIKRAMVRIDARLAAEGLAAEMILQVHDELVFDVPTGETQAVEKLVVEEMESVAELSVPLVVDVGQGRSWREAH